MKQGLHGERGCLSGHVVAVQERDERGEQVHAFCHRVSPWSSFKLTEPFPTGYNKSWVDQVGLSRKKGGEISIVFNGEQALGMASSLIPGGLSRRYEYPQ